MSRKCSLSGKKAQTGMRYSFLRAHYNPTAKRKFEVNLQTVRTKINGRPVKIKVAASVLKTYIDIRKGIDLSKKRKSLKRLRKAISA
ncbi:MAG: 50S ribosomal protein L28 [Candidatus Melainabacteria bacterium RIFCSPHIGHO2_02_FULL_34_12]|nr:MAG: 50S ribosomal protein L28 [Candidatus Melainabacteria bacterium RIFCSPHIGHO2_02_FULL_34_12]